MFMLNENVGSPAVSASRKGLQSSLRNGVRSVVDFVDRNKTKIMASGFIAGASTLAAQAQTDATAIATQAQTAFNTVAPITIGIVAFYVIVRIAKRVVK